jgi:hypothetical protein
VSLLMFAIRHLWRTLLALFDADDHHEVGF